MTHDELIELMVSIPNSIRRKVAAKVGTILALAEPFRAQGAQFTFQSNPSLDNTVKKQLIELSDEIIAEMEDYARESVEDEDKDAVIMWLRETGDNTETIDKYSSHLYFILEGWLAIGFAAKVAKGVLEAQIATYNTNPYLSPLWKEAFKSGEDYAAGIIREGGYHWGQGVPIDPAKGLSITEAHTINKAYNFGVVQGYKRMKAIGYRVHRGSTYDCPQCDELCVGIHPLTEICLPSHPHCVCFTTPVMKADE